MKRHCGEGLGGVRGGPQGRAFSWVPCGCLQFISFFVGTLDGAYNVEQFQDNAQDGEAKEEIMSCVVA